MGEVVKNVTWKEDLRMDFLNIPFMFKYKVSESISVLAGPQIGFLVKAEKETSNNATGRSESNTHSVIGNFERNNMSLCVGAAWEPLKDIGIELRYNMGLYEIEGANTKTSTIQTGLFYKF